MDLTIGKLAKSAGVGVETVRFYERKGLIKQPSKRMGGFRYYPKEDSTRIRFIKRAQELGFTLKEVKELLEFQSKKKLTGRQMQLKAQEKIIEIQKKVSDLKQMEVSLKQLALLCGDDSRAVQECKVFDCFENGCN